MLLKKLCECSGVSGGEGEVRRCIIQELEQIGCPYKVDRIGNVIAVHPGRESSPKLLFAAHMDEPGLMIYDITEEGFLLFKTVGNVNPRQLSGRTVRIRGEVAGIVGFAPYHMMKIAQEHKEDSARHQHIDIGAKDRREALERVQPGDFAVVDSPFVPMGASYKGRALGSRAGCWLLLELLKNASDCTFEVVFTTLSEVGLRGMETAAYARKPELVVSVGAVPATDVPGSLDGEDRIALGDGVCVALADAGFAYPRSTAELWIRRAKERGIPYRNLPYAPAAAQAGLAALVGGGAQALSLLIPCRDPSSPASRLAQVDLEAAGRMLALIAAQDSKEVWG